MKFFDEVFLIAWKELLQLWRDKASLFFTFLIPVFILLAFGMTIPAKSRVPVPVLVVDEDGSAASRALVERIKTSPDRFEFKGSAKDEASAKQDIRGGKAPAAVVVPAGFGERIARGRAPTLNLIFDDSKNLIREYAEMSLADVAGGFDGPGKGAGISVDRDSITGDNLSPRKAVGVLVMGLALIFSGFDDVAGAMARERERGTLSRLFLTPISRWSIFLGKTIASFVLTAVRTTILLFLLVYFVGVSVKGSIALVFAIAFLIAAVTIGIGFLVSVRPISGRSVAILGFALMVPLIFFTGVMRPSELVQESARGFMRLIPYTYANDALRRVVLLGEGFAQIKGDLLYMLGFAIALFCLAGLAMSRRIAGTR